MKTIYLNNFGQSMVSDPRASRGVQLVKHFDNFTRPYSLVPFRDTEDAYASQTTFQGQNFLMYNSELYALGRQSAVARASILKNSDVTGTSWSTPTNAEDGTYTIINYNLFVEYKGIIWGANSNGLWSYNIGSTTFTANAQALTYTHITQGLVHSKDDILYVGYTNSTASYIASKNGAGAWNTTALTLPSNLIVTSICEYGNFLAIACRPSQIGGKSVVYLWDRDSTLTTLSESIDLGNKDVYTMENIDGYLVFVSLVPSLTSSNPSKLIFSYYSGGGGDTVLENLTQRLSISTVPSLVGKQKYNNRLFFGLTGASFEGTTYDYVGVWSIGRVNGEFSVNFTYKPDNDTLPQNIKGFYIVRDFVFISYQDAVTGDYGMSKTNDQASFTCTSVYETQINDGMANDHKPLRKQLMSVAVTYEPLPANGQVVLKYKVDNESYVTVFTETTDNKQFTEASKAGSTEFTAGRDYKFMVESTGGAVITGLAYKYKLLETLI